MSSESPLDWYRRMGTSTDYLSIEHMQEGMAYAIWARNAYVGIWLSERQGFIISRYKMGPVPYLFVEYHWDTGEPCGTAKPLRLLETCPLPLRVDAARDEVNNVALCAWLDALETKHPPLTGWDSVSERRRYAEEWISKLAERRSRTDRPEPIHELIKKLKDKHS